MRSTTPRYQTDYTYSKMCGHCESRTHLGSQHGQWWKPGDSYTYHCDDCAQETTSLIFRHKKAHR